MTHDGACRCAGGKRWGRDSLSLHYMLRMCGVFRFSSGRTRHLGFPHFSHFLFVLSSCARKVFLSEGDTKELFA